MVLQKLNQTAFFALAEWSGDRLNTRSESVQLSSNMPDYYIRTPEQDESRGPFDISKLQTLAEAGQITSNTLFYDEDKEEWIPIALNESLCATVFPQKEKLELKIQKERAAEKKEAASIDVQSMLDAAEGNTKEKRKLMRQKKSFQQATSIASTGIGLMCILSALILILPLVPTLQGAIKDGNTVSMLNYLTVWIAGFDLLLGVLLILSVTEVYPLARARGMLTLGFGIYVGWALGDPLLSGLAAAAGFGIFLATISRSIISLILAFVLGIGGNGYLAYLALNGRFDGFFNHIVFNLVAN
jgi:hypothetical protein